MIFFMLENEQPDIDSSSIPLQSVVHVRIALSIHMLYPSSLEKYMIQVPMIK
jgi:hypothetical protein